MRMFQNQKETEKLKIFANFENDLKFYWESYFLFVMLIQSDDDFTLWQISLHFFLKLVEYNTISFLSNISKSDI